MKEGIFKYFEQVINERKYSHRSQLQKNPKTLKQKSRRKYHRTDFKKNKLEKKIACKYCKWPHKETWRYSGRPSQSDNRQFYKADTSRLVFVWVFFHIFSFLVSLCDKSDLDCDHATLPTAHMHKQINTCLGENALVHTAKSAGERVSASSWSWYNATQCGAACLLSCAATPRFTPRWVSVRRISSHRAEVPQWSRLCFSRTKMEDDEVAHLPSFTCVTLFRNTVKDLCFSFSLVLVLPFHVYGQTQCIPP